MTAPSLRAALAACLAAAAGCAKMEPPPGGPPDTSPPRLISVTPDSLAVLPGFDDDVVFLFDEVISEGGSANLGTGTGDLERLVLLSPSNRVPEVRWRRNRITVRPREGWVPNRVYRIQLLPGVMDLRNNRGTDRATSAVLTFTTGAPVPTARISGTIFDWTTARPAPGALIEAVLLPDSLVYRFTADSAGGFSMGPLPAGRYVVFGTLDQDRDRERDTREAFDSAAVATADTQAIELWTFPHDTAGPRFREVQPRDSVSAVVVFSQPLMPGDTIALAAVSLRRLPDSTAVTVLSLAPSAPDTAAAPPDSAAAARMPSRPPLLDRLVLRVAQPLVPGTRYQLSVRGVRNVNGVAADVEGSMLVPARAPVDSLRPAADSLAPPTDSTPPALPR